MTRNQTRSNVKIAKNDSIFGSILIYALRFKDKHVVNEATDVHRESKRQYKTSPASFLIGRMLVDVPNIGLVNIVAGKTIVPEFLQNEMTAERLAGAIDRIFKDETYRKTMSLELSHIKQKLGQTGASARVAEGIIELGEAA